MRSRRGSSRRRTSAPRSGRGRTRFRRAAAPHTAVRRAGLDEAPLMADLRTQRAKPVVDDLLASRAEENQIAGLRAGARENRLENVRRQELDDRRLQPFLAGLRAVVDLDVREPLGAI